MDYQFIYTNQIRNMDYWSLVQMLSTQITPQMRKCILERLIEINNGLLAMEKTEYSNEINLDKLLGEQNEIDLDKLLNKPNKNILNKPNKNIFTDNLLDPSKPVNNTNKEIDLDDLIDDIHQKENDLDTELAIIKNLRDKIISDKRRRKKEKKEGK